MCIICTDLDNGKLDPWEASRNRTEMLETLITFGSDQDHLKTLDYKIRASLLEYLNNLNEGGDTPNG
jgi:hypothetical protein